VSGFCVCLLTSSPTRISTSEWKLVERNPATTTTAVDNVPTPRRARCNPCSALSRTTEGRTQGARKSAVALPFEQCPIVDRTTFVTGAARTATDERSGASDMLRIGQGRPHRAASIQVACLIYPIDFDRVLWYKITHAGRFK
jgi:hypothetical protein